MPANYRKDFGALSFGALVCFSISVGGWFGIPAGLAAFFGCIVVDYWVGQLFYGSGGDWRG